MTTAKDDKESFGSENDQKLNGNNISDDLKSKINEFSYEDSISKLDFLLNELQSDKVNLNDLQKHYQEAKLHIENCEKLLEVIEQEVKYFDSELLETE